MVKVISHPIQVSWVILVVKLLLKFIDSANIAIYILIKFANFVREIFDATVVRDLTSYDSTVTLFTPLYYIWIGWSEYYLI